MSQALYRKYRSQRFAELVGQQGVTRVLRNAIVRERLGHAYLFCGPRGTGKTSVARIFAKAINCLSQQEGDCCGECDVCQGIVKGSEVDVQEIDAASHRGIDSVKELRDRIKLGTISLKHKVYIIDEVHMITREGFNALLKMLEEPPAHVVFCLCTTEPHQLPVTILSRCIRFDFQRLPLNELSDHLKRIADNEGYNLEDDAAHELAVLAEGSARDSISLLDQLLVYCDKDITLADTRELFQLSDPQLLNNAADLLAQSDAAPLLAIWENLAGQGADAGQFLIRLADVVKERYLTTNGHGWRRSLGKLWEGLNLLKFESFPALLVELTLLSAQQAHCTEPGIASNPARSDLADRNPTSEPPARQSDHPREQPAPARPSAERRPTGSQRVQQRQQIRAASQSQQTDVPDPQSPQAIAPSTHEAWPGFLEVLRKQHMTTYALLQESVIARKDGPLLRLVFDADARPAYRFIQQAKHLEPLKAAMSTAFGPGLQLSIEMAGDPASRVLLQADAQADGPQQSVRSAGVEGIPDTIYTEQLEGLDASVEHSGRHDSNTAAPASFHNNSPGDLGQEIAEASETEAASRPATKQDILELFDAVEIENDSPDAE